MNEKIIFVRTGSGEDEVRSKTAHLSKEIKRALMMVDGVSTVGEISKRSSPSLRGVLEDMFIELANGGFIRNSATPVIAAKQNVELSSSKKQDEEIDELDFTAAYRAPTPAMLAEEEARLKALASTAAENAAAERLAREQAQIGRAQVARVKAEQEAARADAEAAARELAERRASAAVEAARIKARQHAEAEARASVVAQEKARLEAEVSQLRAEAEAVARAREIAEEQARLDAVAVRVQAQQDAEIARVKAEQDAIQARAEARASAEAERRASEALEAIRVSDEQHAAQVREAAEEKARLEAEVVNLKAQAEVEAQARALAEEQAKRGVEAARLQAQEVAERLAREQSEAVRLQAEQAAAAEKARLEAEVAHLKAQAEAEAHARAQAEEQARLADEQAKLQSQVAAEQLAQEQALAARIKSEQIAVRVEIEAAAREAASLQANEALAQERMKAEQQAARLKAEAEARARVAEEEKAALEAQVACLKEQAETESLARAAAEKQAKLAADEAELKAQHQAERLAEEVKAARIKAEQEASQARLEAAQAGQRADAERLAREEVERIARQAEAARVQTEQDAAKIKAEAVALAVAANRAKLEAEVAQLKAQQEEERAAREAAQAALVKAEQETERVKNEAQTRSRAEAEFARQAAESGRLKIEQAAINVREAATHARQAADLRASEEAARRAKEEAKMLRAEQAAAKNKGNVAQAMQRGEAEVQKNADRLAAVVRLNARHAAMEEDVFSALDELAKQQEDEVEESSHVAIEAHLIVDAKPQSAPVAEKRTTIATVAFFDIVSYSTQSNVKQIELKEQLNQLLGHSLDPHGANERVIVDAGDGVAIGFLHHPTDALETAMHFRNGLMANKHYDYPDLRVRTGIHLGPISLVKDMNGQLNMLGDGINSAQRVMSFASNDQVYVSRAYYDFVSSLSDEYDELFRYRGSQQDKHGREFQVYELLDAEGTDDELSEEMVTHEDVPVNMLASATSKLPAFNFDTFDVAQFLPKEQESAQPVTRQSTDVAELLFRDVVAFTQSDIPPAAPVEKSVEKPPVAPVEKSIEKSVEKPSVAPVEKLIEKPSEKPLEIPLERSRETVVQSAAGSAPKLVADVSLQTTQAVSEPPKLKPVASEMSGKFKAFKLAEIRDEAPPAKPLPWGKITAGLFVLLLAALFIVPYLLPTQAYATRIEQWLTDKWHQPVHIGRLSGRLLPTPQLLLNELTIGAEKLVQLRQVQVNYDFSALTGQLKSIKRLELDGLQVSGSALTLAAHWLQQLAVDQRYPVGGVVLTQGKLDADGIQLVDVAGTVNFDQSGKFTQANLNTNKLTLEIRAAPDQKMQLTFSLKDSALPTLPNLLFDDLKATGELTGEELRISSLDGRLMGGVLTGDARINWQAGWLAQGSLVASVIPMQNINKLLSGDLDGSAQFSMRAASLSKLADTAVLNGTFNVKKGVISGVDVVETARLRSRENLPGGRTHFDDLRGEFSYSGEAYLFRPLKINTSVMNATGVLAVNKQQLTGTISADLTMRSGLGTATLQVDGTTDRPTLHAR